MDETSIISRVMKAAGRVGQQALEPRGPDLPPMSPSANGRAFRESFNREDQLDRMVTDSDRSTMEARGELGDRDKDDASMYRAHKDRGRRLRKMRRQERSYRRSIR